MSLKSWWQNRRKKAQSVRREPWRVDERPAARPYSQPVIKTPEEYLRDGGDRSRRTRESQAYDETVTQLRQDREALAADNARLRGDRDRAWGTPVSYDIYGDPFYQGPNVVDLTEGGHHHHHEPDVVVVEEHHHHYDQEDDHQSHMREDYEADQSAAQTAYEPPPAAPDPDPAPAPTQTDQGFYGSDSSFYGSGDTSSSSSGDSSSYGSSDSPSYDSGPSGSDY